MASSKYPDIQQQPFPPRLRFSTISRENINDIQVNTLTIYIEIIEITRCKTHKNKFNITRFL